VRGPPVAVAVLLLAACSCGPLGGADGGGGGAPGGGGDAAVPLGELCAGGIQTTSHLACSAGDPPCHLTCGPLKSGFRNCTCGGETWGCEDGCRFDPTHDYGCFALPPSPAACPPSADDPDPSGMNLAQSGDSCSLPPCTPCGSATENAFRDSTGTPKPGFCVCSGAAMPTYSCATVAAWPPPAAR